MLTILALMLASPAVDMTAEDADSRCLAAFALVAARKPDAGSADPNAAKAIEAGKIGAIYFTGKLLGRNPQIDLEAAMRRVMPALTPVLTDETRRCAVDLQNAGLKLVSVGNALQK
ncbi:hypothetical protein [uncultured Sphingomonas sp.]|uniref:hypothetical protein n=1 Tax=uncultured Sphingomonas sp. TaxID=158754 RepID=UPI0035C988A9